MDDMVARMPNTPAAHKALAAARRAARAARTSRPRRDEAIRKAEKAGVPQVLIAKATGLSYRIINRIVRSN